MAARFFDLEAGCSDESDTNYSGGWTTAEETTPVGSSAKDEDAEIVSIVPRDSGSTTERVGSQETMTVITPVRLASVTPTTTSVGRFRIAATRIVLTFPHCDLAKSEVLLRLQQKWSDSIKWAVVAQETHQDSSLHLHIGICFTSKRDFKNARFADDIGGKHGKYEAMRNELDFLKYITKEDKNPAVMGIDLEVLAILSCIEWYGEVHSS